MVVSAPLVEHERGDAGGEAGPEPLELLDARSLGDDAGEDGALAEQADPALAALATDVVGLDGLDADRELVGVGLALLDLGAGNGVEGREEALLQLRQVVRGDGGPEGADLDGEGGGGVVGVGGEEDALAALDVEGALDPGARPAEGVAPLGVVVELEDAGQRVRQGSTSVCVVGLMLNQETL
jgi:hypothetical protein